MALVAEGIDLLYQAAGIIESGAEGVAAYDEISGNIQKGVKRLRNIVTPDNTPNKRHNSNNPGPGRGVPPETMPFKARNEGTGDHEVPVIPPPKRLALSCPDYFTIDLPWAENGYATFSRTTGVVTPNQIASYRLNSIFDPQKIDGGTASTSGGAAHQPMGRDTWAAVYQYYRVLKSTIHITMWNFTSFTPVTAADHEVIVAGIEWTDDDTTSGKAETVQAFMEEKQSQTQLVLPVKGTTFLTGGPAHFTYDYAPEEWHFHVQNSADDNRWTAIAADPTLPHYLNLSIFPFIPGSTTTQNYKVLFHTRIVYTVQFREANYSHIQTSH